jgi:hypothetical protein
MGPAVALKRVTSTVYRKTTGASPGTFARTYTSMVEPELFSFVPRRYVAVVKMMVASLAKL